MKDDAIINIAFGKINKRKPLIYCIDCKSEMENDFAKTYYIDLTKFEISEKDKSKLLEELINADILQFTINVKK